MRLLSWLCVLGCAGVVLADINTPPRSPEDSLKVIHVPDGFVVEQVAAEPLVNDPVAIDWDADGRLWVAEMLDYPMGIDDMGKPGGRIRVLSDTNGDGRYDSATVFAENLPFPNGVKTWRKGVLVTAAPDILYLEDTDGDGKADVRRVMYHGFGEGNQQLRANGLRYGLDGWLYGANGWSGGKVTSTQSGAILDLGGRGGPDFRIQPDTGAIEPESGTTQYGRSRDDWGHWFGCDNSHLAFHFVLEDRVLRRNPHAVAPDPKQQLVLPKNPPVYPRSQLRERFHADYMANRFTSACGVAIYRDTLLFNDMESFTCEPVHNVVSRRLLSREGASFTARRAPGEATSEFFASEDHWSRPVMARTGPDGALWIVDMYRFMVEHPHWVPKEQWEKWKDKVDMRAGHDRGRIYRVYRKDAAPRQAPALAKMNTADLIAQLESPNGELRDMVQQVLIWRQDATAIAPLKTLAQKSDRSLARLHALYTLDGLKSLEIDQIAFALKDADAGVRSHALRLAEPYAANQSALLSAATRLTADPDLEVRLQLAGSLALWPQPQAGQALGLLAQQVNDPIMAAVVASSAPAHFKAVVDAITQSDHAPHAGLFGQLLITALGEGHRDVMAQLLEAALKSEGGQLADWQTQALADWLEALPRQKLSLESLAKSHDDALARMIQHLPIVMQAARVHAADTHLSEAGRIAAIRLLGYNPSQRAEDAAALFPLIHPKTPDGVQAQTLQVLRRLGDARTPEALLAAWPAMLPDLRGTVVDMLLSSRKTWTIALLDQIESGAIARFDIDAARRRRLAQHSDNAIRARAEKLLEDPASANRAKVVEQHRAAQDLAGDTASGKAIFARICAACHQMDGVGHAIGPDLRSVTDRSADGLLVAILDPNRNVEPRYVGYVAQLNGGETLFGLITGQSGETITLVGLDGKSQSIRRGDLKSIQSLGRSLMPDGLEGGLNDQDLADLIRYLGYPGAP